MPRRVALRYSGLKCVAGSPPILLLFLFVIPLRAQEKPNPYQHMLRSKQQVTEYLVRQARRITGAAAQEISSKDNWEKVREQRRKETLQMLGLDPLPPRTPLNVQITGVIGQPEYPIEKIAFESMPQIENSPYGNARHLAANC